MFVDEIVLTIGEANPAALPRLGEVLIISLPRMDEPQEFAVAEINVKRVWMAEGGDDEGYYYRGKVTLAANYQGDDDEDDGDGEDETEPSPAPAEEGKDHA